MAALTQCRVAVVGAGIFGMAAAWALVRAGAQVALHDAAPQTGNASRVAAGMLAPALEAALDPVSSEHFDLLRAGRDSWTTLLDGVPASQALIRRSGALFLGGNEATSGVAARLDAIGAEWCWATEADAGSLAPGQASGDEGVFTPEDWLASPAAILDALGRAFLQAGGRFCTDQIGCVGGRLVVESTDSELEADLVVMAAGDGARRFIPAIPELSVLAPIKGQILHYAAGPAAGAVVRTGTAYVAPQAGGAIVGATMEAGSDDLALRPADIERLRTEAERLFPELRGVPFTGRAGVRAATPDGLPMVGLSQSGTALAVGARRNGWLLAPLVAERVLALAGGGPSGPFDPLFAPDRFGA